MTGELLPPANLSSLVPNQQRVFVANDEKIIADTLRLILSQHGFEVDIAYDGKAAIAKAREFRPQSSLAMS